MSELHKAFIAAQTELPSVAADSTNPHFKSKFVSLDHLIAETRPILNKHGLAITQEPIIHNGSPALQTTLLHTSGEYRCQVMPLILAGQDMQKLGAAITYARRYAWSSLLGIGEPDDDGETAVNRGKFRSAPKIGPNVLIPAPGDGAHQEGGREIRNRDHGSPAAHTYNPATPPTPDAAPATGTQQEPAAGADIGGGLPIPDGRPEWRPHPMPPIATEAFKVASGGLAAYERWFLSLSKSERQQLKPYHDMIKGAAAEADAN